MQHNRMSKIKKNYKIICSIRHNTNAILLKQISPKSQFSENKLLCLESNPSCPDYNHSVYKTIKMLHESVFHQNFVGTSPSYYARYVSHSSHLPWFNNPVSTRWSVGYNFYAGKNLMVNITSGKITLHITKNVTQKMYEAHLCVPIKNVLIMII
jgi:hypothetical protein